MSDVATRRAVSPECRSSPPTADLFSALCTPSVFQTQHVGLVENQQAVTAIEQSVATADCCLDTSGFLVCSRGDIEESRPSREAGLT
jgi:hypothetical protein